MLPYNTVHGGTSGKAQGERYMKRRRGVGGGVG